MYKQALLLLFITSVVQANTWTCRTESVEPGGLCYVWRTEGGLPMQPPSVPEGWKVFQPANYSIGGWHWQWAFGIQISGKAKPGTYRVGDIEITVRPKLPTRKLKRISVSNSQKDCQKWLDAGYDIELTPGLHKWDRSLSVPDGATISSAGAWCVRSSNGEYEDRMFVPQGSMTLDGLTLSHDSTVTWPVYIHAYPTPPGRITVRNCIVRDGELFRCYSPGVLVQKCVFERATSGQVPPCSVWDACEFRGHAGPGRHAWFNTGTEGGLVVNCRWTGTTRGMVFQGGPARGWMVLDNYFDNIRGGDGNANEVILFEAGTNGDVVPGNGIQDITIIDAWINNCAGAGIILYGSGMDRINVHGADIHVDNMSLSVIAMRGGRMGKNHFSNLQCTGGLDFRGDVGHVSLGNVQILKNVQRRGNQGPFTPNMKFFNESFPVRIDDEAKRKGTFAISGCGVVSLDKYDELVIE